MSKDKYSSDHTIEVAGDGDTLILASNVEVEDDLEVGGDLAVTGSATVGSLTISGGDLTLTDDLTVSGTATIDDLVVSGTATRSVAESVNFNLQASSFVPLGNWASGFTHTVDSSGISVTIPAGESLNASHSLEAIPNGCEIDNLRISYKPNAASGYSVEVLLFRRGKISNTTVEIASTSEDTGSSGNLNIASITNLGHEVDSLNFSYWVVFRVDAPGGATLLVYDVEVSCDITSYS